MGRINNRSKSVSEAMAHPARRDEVHQAMNAELLSCTMSARYLAGGLPSAFLNMVMNAVTDS
jgi:hypothetical protein